MPESLLPSARRRLRGRHLAAAGCGLGLTLAATAPWAQAQAQPQAQAQARPLGSTATSTTLPTVNVRSSTLEETPTSPVVGYRAKQAVTATKTDTPLSETPQSVTIVTRDQMVDQGATSLQDALTYAAGVRSDAWGLDGRADSFLIRGTEPSVYLDGLQQNSSGWYTATTRTDPFTLERIEVLRGPAGMLFGAGTAAGVVNMVSKRPLQEAQGEIGLTIGNRARRQIQADLTGPLTEDKTWSYRLIAVYRKADTQVDHVPDDRALLAPSLAWRPNGRTSLIVQGHWQQDKSGSTSQFLPWSGTLTANPNGQLPSNRYIGEPGDGYDSQRRSLGWLFEHQFNDQLTFRQAVRVARNHNDSHYHYGDFWTVVGGWGQDPINQRLLGRINFRGLYETRMAGTDNHLQATFATGPVRHTLLLGADYSRQRQDVRQGSVESTIDAYAPVYGGPGYLPVTELTTDPRARQRNAGVYLQDQLRWDNWIIVAGLRHDRSTSATEGSEDETTRANTKRLGLMYALPAGWSPYVSYTESFTPQAGRTEEGVRYKPLRGEQVEAGVKYNPADRPLSATAAVYRLKEKNRTISDPTNPNFGRQVDSSVNKGVELAVKATLASNVDLLAWYTWIDVDRQLGVVPRSQAAVWGKYRFALGDLPGFEAGAGVRYLSAFHDTTDVDTGPRIASVTLADLMLAFERNRWRYSMNVNNLADKKYFSTCLARGDCWWGSRRTVYATASYRF